MSLSPQFLLKIFMLNFLPAFIIGPISLILYTLNTIFWLIPILVFSLLKALIPISFSQKIFSYLLDLMASGWVAVNTINQKIFTQVEIELTGLETLSTKDWYLVLANHQSWVDILAVSYTHLRAHET